MTVPVPAVRLEAQLEGVPRLHVVADSYHDERRLRAWLRSSPVLDQIGHALANLPDSLDAIDEAGSMVAPFVAHLAQLEHARSRGSRDWIATCPICRARALAVHNRGDGRLLVTCFANGCSFNSIRSALDRAAA